MMMAVMVINWDSLFFSYHLYNTVCKCNILETNSMLLQLFYSGQGSMQIVVHSQDLLELILRVHVHFLCSFSSPISVYIICLEISICTPGGGFKISPLKSHNGRPRTQVQHLMQIDLKGWIVGYLPSFQQYCLIQMLNSVAGMIILFISNWEPV